MYQSESIELLAGALSKAQGDMKDAAKDSKNPHFNSRYADLASVREAVSGPLAAHGLAVTQIVVPRTEVLTFERGDARKSAVQWLASLRTTLMHTSGQWTASELPIVGDWGDPQKIGSCITYARRYALAAICGVAQDDDDANAATGKQLDKVPVRRPLPPPPRKPSAFAVPRTGAELLAWIEHRRESADLKLWIWEEFGDQDYPDRLTDWSPEQVASALPAIGKYLRAAKPPIASPAPNGNGFHADSRN